MFKPCPNCGFLVALIAGREASQRCPRCSSALVDEADLPPAQPEPAPRRRYRDAPLDAQTVPPDARDTAMPASVAAAPPSARAEPHPDADAGTRVEATVPADRESAADDQDAAEPGGADPRDGALPASAAETAGNAAGHEGPSFARRRRAPRRGGRRWPWAVALPLLALLLAAQLLLAQRAELARDARWRPLVMHACATLGCEVPAWREPAAYAMLARGVRPARPGVLHVSATVRNDARWPQPPPVVVLRLADVEGRPVGARAVAPADYGRRGTLVAPGDSLDIAFDVREPAVRVESFDFQLQ